MNVTAFQSAYLSRIETIKQPEEINILVANALRFIVRNVFAKMSNTFFITISAAEGPVEFWLHDLMSKLFISWSFMALQLVVLDQKIKSVEVPGKRYCNMILIDSFESLEKTNIATYNRNSDGQEYYFIFLQVPDHKAANEMKRIFKYCFDNYWIHCNIMLQNSIGEILVYTYFPFEANNCFQTEPKLINQYKGKRFVNDIMFPNKLRNLHKCPLKLSTWETPPFVINATNNKFPDISVSGFEILTMIAISQQMNFTLDIDWISTETYYESSESGPLSKLKNLETNITMGYFRRTADRDKIATPTYVTYYIPIAAVIMRRQVQHISIGLYTFAFDKTTWILIIIFYGLIGVIHSFRSKTGTFQIFEIFIGMPAATPPRKASKRIRFVTILLSSFILRSIYQSLLFFLFRTNFYQPSPITLNGLVEAGYKAVSTELTKEFLLYVPEIEDKTLPLITLNTTNEMYPLAYVDRYRNESYVAMSIVEFTIRYVREEMAVGEALRILPINVKDQQIGFYLAKHSYLSRHFDYYILHFHQAGLLNKWREWTNIYYQVTTRRSSTAYDGSFMISLKHLAGFLFLIVTLYGMSLIIFGLELLSMKYCKWLQKFLG